MTIFNNSYDTKLGSSHQIRQIEEGIKKAILKDYIDDNNINIVQSLDYKPIFITGFYDSESNIILFDHPFVINNFNNKNYICLDIRSYLRNAKNIYDFRENPYKYIGNKTGFNIALNRLIMELYWITKTNNNKNNIKYNLNLAGVVFANLISEKLSKTYALDYKDQLYITIITYFYYQTLFTNSDNLDDKEKEIMGMLAVKILNIKSEFVFPIIDKITTMNSLKDLCENIKNICENIRLEHLDEGAIITVIGNSWYSIGVNSKELLAISLEHIPTWLVIVYAALSDKSYKNTNIANIASRHGKGGKGDEYIKNIDEILNEYKIQNND